MLKTVYILRRKPGMTLEEFQTYWLEKHAPLVKQHARALGIKRYIQVHTRPLQEPRRPDPIRGQMLDPFDGVAEVWVDPESATGTEEEREKARKALAEDEAKFLDFANSAIWRGEEHFIIQGQG